MTAKQDDVGKVEDWAGVPLLRFYHYLRRRYFAKAEDKALGVDEVTTLTRELEKLANAEDKAERIAAVRGLLWINAA